MILKAIHRTSYEYSAEVFIEPHYLRFQPRILPNNKLISSEIRIFPAPAGKSEQRDAENNVIHFCWFEGLHPSLEIESEVIFELNENNPFNFLLFPPSCADMPFQYEASLAGLLHASLEPLPAGTALINYGKDILEQSNGRTIDFVSLLSGRIHDEFELIYRMEGEPFTPDETFENKRGSCRDFAWMQISLLRYFGIASRFVSGYFFIESAREEHDLHGWLEIYLPGAGWMGFDPSNGGATGDDHIPVCASAFYQKTMPVTGSVRGDATSTMSTHLTLEKYEALVN